MKQAVSKAEKVKLQTEMISSSSCKENNNLVNSLFNMDRLIKIQISDIQTDLAVTQVIGLTARCQGLLLSQSVQLLSAIEMG